MTTNFIDMDDPFLKMVKRNRFVVLDTETTGLRYPSEIVQIAICDFMGSEILNTYVRCVLKIPKEATAIHGITNDMLEDAPAWGVVRDQVYEILHGKDVIVYNAAFDFSMLEFSDQVIGVNNIHWHEICDPHCAMLWYADLYGEWDDYHGTNRWQKLTNAVHQQQLIVGNAHDAMGDVQMTYALVKHLLAKQASDHLLS